MFHISILELDQAAKITKWNRKSKKIIKMIRVDKENISVYICVFRLFQTIL